ncbi:ABC transporter ATP-binding protein [Cognatilysobacter bugurensis]
MAFPPGTACPQRPDFHGRFTRCHGLHVSQWRDRPWAIEGGAATIRTAHPPFSQPPPPCPAFCAVCASLPPMTDSTAIIRLRGLRLERGGRVVLRDLDLEIARGEVVAVFGPSGSGKSTLLSALTGELAPSAGSVEVLDRPVPAAGRALLDLRKGLGVLLQGNGLLTDLTAAENVALPLRTHTDLPAPVIARLVDMKLHAVGLRAAADAFPRELSGGMARRVALARALALDPPLMLYDEPLTGLDPIACGVVMSLVRRLNDTLGLTSVVVTHHVHETLPVADRAVVIADGRLVFSGTPAELQASSDPLIRQFLDGQPDGPIPFDNSTFAGAVSASAQDAA